MQGSSETYKNRYTTYKCEERSSSPLSKQQETTTIRSYYERLIRAKLLYFNKKKAIIDRNQSCSSSENSPIARCDTASNEKLKNKKTGCQSRIHWQELFTKYLRFLKKWSYESISEEHTLEKESNNETG